MSADTFTLVDKFYFRDLHQHVLIGAASDRYAGWIGQVYSRGRYDRSITRRSHRVGAHSFVEEVLPVESVGEFFVHFAVLEIDYTFYRPLVDRGGKPNRNHQVLRTYKQHLRDDDSLILKVPQMVTAQKIRSGGGYIANETYLNPDVFTTQFYAPANEVLGANLAGFIFEQEYQRARDRVSTREMAEALDGFFSSIPNDNRYHIELRTEAYLHPLVFAVLRKHGVGQVLSHWTWLPSLGRQLAKSEERFSNGGNECIIRLMTPLGVRYEDAYARAFPFNKLVDRMLQEEMVEDAARIMMQGVEQGTRMYVVVNNRSGGNAPMIAQRIAQRFLELCPPR
ncbi:MAG: DUF72 domain-containing protein [Deltaproteobacteria bacterium]|nr:DUF72 domain-containing protein [Deltaproteobacteria bacterium]